MSSIQRSLVKQVKGMLNRFPCVVLLGARQVGKSTMLRQIFPQAKIFDLEKNSDFNRIDNDPELFINEVEKPLIIDEAQLCPKLFNALRVAIDANRSLYGQFLLTGSSSPELLKNISESLAGRVAILEVPTFDWSEATQSSESNFVKNLAKPEALLSLKANLSKQELNELCLHGSYPEPFLRRDDTIFFENWMENYFKTYIDRDIRALFPTLNFDAFKKFIRMLAVSSGDLINASNFARSLDVSQPTIKKYFEIVEGTFLWRSLKCYSKNTKKRLVKMPKGHLRDPGLINYLLKNYSVDDLKSHPNFGKIWETFIIEQILKRLSGELIHADAFFYRTHNQSEIDLILEGKFGLVPIEIKSGSSTEASKLKVLENFIEEQQCPYGIVINNGDEVFKLSPKILQIPAIYL